MPASPDWYGSVFGLLGGGTIASLATLLVQRRKRSAEAIDAEVGTNDRLLARVEALTASFVKEQASRTDCEQRCIRMETELRHLREVLPAALLANAITSLTPSLLAVLDGASDGWVITTPTDGATWVYANAPMCRLLKMPLAAVLERGWRRLIAAEDLEPTMAVESGQWGETVTCVNTYVASDGTRVKFRWLGMRYAAGMALSLARVVPLLPP